MRYNVDTEMETYLGPLDDMVDVLFAVWQILADGLLVAVQHTGLRRLAGLNRHRPRAMLNASGDVVGASIGVGGGEVHVKSTSWAVEGVERVHACDLASIGIHAPCGFTRLDVAPDCTKSAKLIDCC
jgi:hypothetical protein